MYWELSGDKCPSDPDRPEMEKGPGKDARPGPSLVRVSRAGILIRWQVLNFGAVILGYNRCYGWDIQGFRRRVRWMELVEV